MPELIKALLFVNVETMAPGAARFANGDWSQIDRVMPIIDRVVRHIGWSSFVMAKFLDLCQRSGRSYPITMLGAQANATFTIPAATGASYLVLRTSAPSNALPFAAEPNAVPGGHWTILTRADGTR